jgi:arginase
MRPFAVFHAPSILGLRPSGVERLPEALEAAGLSERIGAEYAGRIDPPPYDPARDPDTGILNGAALREFSLQLADAVSA